MTAEQIAQLLRLLEKIADRPFTITQASDWPLFVFLSAIGLGMLGFMWRDIGKKLDCSAAAIGLSLSEHKADNLREHDKLWNALRDCQDDCCLSKPHKDLK